MTDKTDIAALRDLAERIKAAMASCVESFCMEVADSIENEIGRELTEQEHQQISETASGLLVAQDQLEAERQQREAAEAELSDLLNQEFQQRLANAEHQLEMKDLAIRNVKASRMAQFRKRKVAEAELAELRGEQEPVAWIKCGEVTTEPTTADVWIREMNEGYGYDVEVLCKRQPKPVVVLPEKSINDYNRYNIDYQDTVKALEAAGIVVKDGEKTTKQARTNVIGSYENSSGGLSYIATLAEHKGVGMCLVCEGKHPPGLPCPSLKVISGIENDDGE